MFNFKTKYFVTSIRTSNYIVGTFKVIFQIPILKVMRNVQ